MSESVPLQTRTLFTKFGHKIWRRSRRPRSKKIYQIGWSVNLASWSFSVESRLEFNHSNRPRAYVFQIWLV